MSAPTYITDDDLKKTLAIETASFADEDVTRAVKASSRAIDEITGRVFFPSPTLAPTADGYEPEVRFFTTDHRRRVDIDDLLHVDEIATLQADFTTYRVWASTEYVLEPLNAAVKGKPYEQIRSRARHGHCSFPHYDGAVRVTGRFGWETPPAQVVQLAIVLSSKLLKRAREAPFGIVAFGIDVASALRIARTDPDLALLLEGLERRAVLA